MMLQYLQWTDAGDDDIESASSCIFILKDILYYNKQSNGVIFYFTNVFIEWFNTSCTFGALADSLLQAFFTNQPLGDAEKIGNRCILAKEIVTNL